jgi:hypothetical protein
MGRVYSTLYNADPGGGAQDWAEDGVGDAHLPIICHLCHCFRTSEAIVIDKYPGKTVVVIIANDFKSFLDYLEIYFLPKAECLIRSGNCCRLIRQVVTS